MPKTATVFKDIGKLCNDLLSKDYKVGKATVEVKSKTPSGVTFTPTAFKDDKGKVEGSLKAAYSFLPWLDGECTFGTAGTVSVSLEAADALTKGLTLTCEADRAVGKSPAKANLIADYKSELFACKTSYDYYKKDLLASCSTVYSTFAFGLDGAFSTTKGSLSKYSAACQFVQPEFSVAGKFDCAKAKTLTCSYFHKVSGDMQLGVEIAKPLDGEVAIQFGTMYKLDKDTNVKAKVNSDGKLSAAYKQKISALTTMTLAAVVDTTNLEANNHKFGLQLNVTP